MDGRRASNSGSSLRPTRRSRGDRSGSSTSRHYADDGAGEVVVEVLFLPVAILVGGGILWAVLTEVVYRLARRGWEDEGLALRDRQSETLPREPVQ